MKDPFNALLDAAQSFEYDFYQPCEKLKDNPFHRTPEPLLGSAQAGKKLNQLFEQGTRSG